MATVNNATWNHAICVSDRSGTPSTFLIPEEQMEALEGRLKYHGCTLRAYLRLVLARCKGQVLNQRMKAATRCKKQYQAAGQNLRPRHFRPIDRDWLELGLLADSLGMTRCLLFILLLHLELGSNRAQKETYGSQNGQRMMVACTKLHIANGICERRLEEVHTSHRTIHDRFLQWMKNLFPFV